MQGDLLSWEAHNEMSFSKFLKSQWNQRRISWRLEIATKITTRADRILSTKVPRMRQALEPADVPDVPWPPHHHDATRDFEEGYGMSSRLPIRPLATVVA
eukprot:Plantae.Rhodophyta-Rhodochaete_pulchella.ctg2090.p3 GENE.Plantae.Rhodophyta-Rhodochaete_pulchella.ctg2090~~Plantae.Rhodophyta-Rhodochaete_pulchella.ctg2090.p3  ORF type:complete len:100 (-),score=4.01 Plantae.Rhodophyta-Rhodochaete_pulchella.ctg2090:2151-2450(-)